MDALTVVRWLVAFAYAGLGVLALMRARRNRRPAPNWLAASFLLLGAGLLNARAAALIGGDWASGPGARITVTLLALFPYGMYRFRRTLLPDRRSWVAAAALLLTVLAPVTAWLAPGPYDFAASDSPLVAVSLLLLLVQWGALMGSTAVRLWRAGRDQAPSVRGRTRLLGAGTGVLGTALLVAIALAGRTVPGLTASVQAIGLLAAVAFYLGFAPPAALRALWRRNVDVVLQSAEAELVLADSPETVGRVIVPRVRDVLGARSAALVLDDGRVAASDGLDELGQEALLRACRTPDDSGVLIADLRNGCLAVEPGRFAPYYGRDERDLLETFAFITGLALERAELLASERRSNERLRSAHAELEALVYGISHDLKNPIISLLGYSELLREDYGDELDEDARHYLERMTVSASYMHELLNDLLELSRIGRIASEPEAVELTPLAAEVAEFAEQRHPTITVRSGDLPVVNGNPVRLRQLLTNLVENAAKHGGRPDITIEIVEEPAPPGYATVVVRDDGVGIPPEHRERVFGIFERLSIGPAEETGTGIGLAICRRIVEANGGAIRVRDVPSGTEVEITLPTAPDVDEQPEAGVGSTSSTSTEAARQGDRSSLGGTDGGVERGRGPAAPATEEAGT